MLVFLLFSRPIYELKWLLFFFHLLYLAVQVSLVHHFLQLPILTKHDNITVSINVGLLCYIGTEEQLLTVYIYTSLFSSL